MVLGLDEALDEDSPNHIHPQVKATTQDRAEIHQLFLSLPLILEDPHYRIVHASCNEETHLKLQAYDNGVLAPTEHEDERHLLHAYHYFAQEISQQIAHIDDKMTKALTRQNGNPVKLCTSGPEEPAKEPYYMKGKERITKRQHWWKTYEGQHQVIFGHYWRKLPASMGIEPERFTPRRERTAPEPFKETLTINGLAEACASTIQLVGATMIGNNALKKDTVERACVHCDHTDQYRMGHHGLWFDTGQRLIPD